MSTEAKAERDRILKYLESEASKHHDPDSAAWFAAYGLSKFIKAIRNGEHGTPETRDACVECGADAEHMHHVVPKSVGGTFMVPLCTSCHAKAHGLHDKTWAGHKGLTRAALAVKARRGERVGEVPLGARVAGDGVHLEPCPVEARALDTIRELRAAGLSIRAVAGELNRRGVPARGARWHPTTVARVLSRADNA